MKKYLVLAILAAMATSSLSGCGMHMMPSASATLLAPNSKKGSLKFASIGAVVSEEDCKYNWPLYLGASGNYSLSHERLITKILEQYKADALVDAELSYTDVHIWSIFRSRCAEVKGRPARLTVEREVKK